MEQDKTTWPHNRFVLNLLTFILTRNYFTFMDQMYLQTQGVAMGTCCAPSYANLYLGGWERWIFADEQFDQWLTKVRYWFRYIDDLLIIWMESKDELLSSLNAPYVNEFNLKFTQISFLDLTTMIDDGGDLVTDLYRKPSSGNMIIHASSLHPTPLIHGIP